MIAGRWDRGTLEVKDSNAWGSVPGVSWEHQSAATQLVHWPGFTGYKSCYKSRSWTATVMEGGEGIIFRWGMTTQWG